MLNMQWRCGLNTSDPNATPTQTSDLLQEYNTLKAKYSITDAQIETYYKSSLNATTDKLPGGCN